MQHAQTNLFVDVAPLGPIPELLTYALPPEWQGLARPGMRVLVPLGERVVTGCIVAFQDTPPVHDAKFVLELLDDEPALTSDLLALTQWMATYYVATWGETIRAALPRTLQSGSVQTIMLSSEGQSTTMRAARTALESHILTALSQHRSLTFKQLQRQIAAPGLRSAIQRLAAEGVVKVSQKVAAPKVQAPTESLFTLALPAEEIKSTMQRMERRAPQQAALLRHLLQTGTATAAELRQHLSGATQVVRILEQKGLLMRVERPRAPLLAISTETAFLDEPDVTLTTPQREALEHIQTLIQAGEFASVLLHGVTGSGKTEVYMRAMAAALDARQAGDLLGTGDCLDAATADSPARPLWPGCRSAP